VRRNAGLSLNLYTHLKPFQIRNAPSAPRRQGRQEEK
jgi:hypothetical protein